MTDKPAIPSDYPFCPKCGEGWDNHPIDNNKWKCRSNTDKLLTREEIEALRAFPYCSSITKAEVESLGRTALHLMDERDALAAKYDESYSDDDYKVIREAVQTFSIRNTKLEAERDKYKRLIETANNRCGCHFDEDGEKVLAWCAAHAAYRKQAEAYAAEEAELREALEACAYETVRSPSYAGGGGPSYGICKLCKAEQIECSPPDWKHTHKPDCPLSRPANERGKELLEKARNHAALLKKYDDLLAERNKLANTLCDKYFAMKDEAARLREALEKTFGLIVGKLMPPGWDKLSSGPSYQQCVNNRVKTIIEAALRGEQGEA